MTEQWITFTEAIHLMCRRLRMIEMAAKPLLRSVVKSGRVAGRGEMKERGAFAGFSFNGELDDNPDIEKAANGTYYECIKSPGEVQLSDLRSWLVEFEAEGRLAAPANAALPATSILNTISTTIPSRMPAGRKRTHDWEAALLELFRLELVSGTTNRSQMDLVRHLQDWFSSTSRDGESTPSESQIKERVRRFQEVIRTA